MSAKRGEIDQLLLDKLSDVLTYDQKIRKIGKLLTSLRERNRREKLFGGMVKIMVELMLEMVIELRVCLIRSCHLNGRT